MNWRSFFIVRGSWRALTVGLAGNYRGTGGVKHSAVES